MPLPSPVAVYVLTPATSGEEHGKPVVWEGTAVNGVSVHVTDDGRTPAMLLKLAYAQPGGQPCATLGTLSAVFTVADHVCGRD